jgi:hypothetical protein
MKGHQSADMGSHGASGCASALKAQEIRDTWVCAPPIPWLEGIQFAFYQLSCYPLGLPGTFSWQISEPGKKPYWKRSF